jgi:hypothetical protein
VTLGKFLLKLKNDGTYKKIVIRSVRDLDPDLFFGPGSGFLPPDTDLDPTYYYNYY